MGCGSTPIHADNKNAMRAAGLSVTMPSTRAAMRRRQSDGRLAVQAITFSPALWAAAI